MRTQCLISKSKVKFTDSNVFENKLWSLWSCVCCYFLRLRLITLTETLIIPDVTKTSSNNCFQFYPESGNRIPLEIKAVIHHFSLDFFTFFTQLTEYTTHHCFCRLFMQSLLRTIWSEMYAPLIIWKKKKERNWKPVLFKKFQQQKPVWEFTEIISPVPLVKLMPQAGRSSAHIKRALMK